MAKNKSIDQSIYQKAYREKNKEVLNAKQREYYTNNKEAFKEINKIKYQKRNESRSLDEMENKRLIKNEAARKYNKKYMSKPENKEKRNAYYREKRAKLKALKVKDDLMVKESKLKKQVSVKIIESDDRNIKPDIQRLIDEQNERGLTLRKSY